ncbi:hypothetical protein BKA81DRAFT_364150 [Phyllosticta paracitricarpa]
MQACGMEEETLTASTPIPSSRYQRANNTQPSQCPRPPSHTVHASISDPNTNHTPCPARSSDLASTTP